MENPYLLGLLCLFPGFLIVHQVSSLAIRVPKAVIALEGSCVEVPCHTQPHQWVIWYQYHAISYPKVYDGKDPASVKAQFRGRTTVRGNATEGDCTLRIDSVTRADNDLRVYVWINTERSRQFHHQTVTITVVKRAPVLSKPMEMVDGGIFQANCSIRHACPSSPPSLDWSINPFPKNSTLRVFNKEVQGQWLYTVQLQGRVTYMLHNKRMKCMARFNSKFSTESQPITLNVLYKPLTVNLKVEEDQVIEGHTVVMECLTDCNPQPYMYSWLRRRMDQNNQLNSSQNKMTFTDIERDTSLSCIAHNSIGEGQSDWLHLDAKFAPVILADSACMLMDGALSCVCHAEARPNASITWTIDGNNTFPSSFTSVITYKNSIVCVEFNGSSERAPNVSCTATNSLGGDTRQLLFNKYSNKCTPTKILPGMFTALAFGGALLVGCGIFMLRRYQRQRSQPQLVRISIDVTGALMKAERSTKPSIYENDCVPKTPGANATRWCRRSPAELQHNTQGANSNVDDIYLNC